MEKKVFRAITCLTLTLFLLSHMTRRTSPACIPATPCGYAAALRLNPPVFLLSHMTRGTASPQTSLGEDADLEFQLPHALFEVVILFGKPCNLRFQFF